MELADRASQEITEAFNVLCHPEAREKYDKEIAQGTATNAMDRQEIARRLTAKGSQALRSGNMTGIESRRVRTMVRIWSHSAAVR